MFWKRAKLRREVRDLIEKSILISDDRKKDFLVKIRHLNHSGLEKFRDYLKSEWEFIIKTLPKVLEGIPWGKEAVNELANLANRKTVKNIKKIEKKELKEDQKEVNELLDLL
jgi:hypothetical protein